MPDLCLSSVLVAKLVFMVAAAASDTGESLILVQQCEKPQAECYFTRSE